MTTLRSAAIAAAATLAPLISGCSHTPSQPQSGIEALEQRRAQAQRAYEKGQELTLVGQYDDAINVYKESVTLDPRNMLAWYYLGVICNHQRRYAEAVEAWRIAADLTPSDPRAYFALGLQYQDLGLLPDAAQCYDRALERDANYLPALKKAVEVDQLQETYTDTTLERIHRALLQETDPKWVDFLRLMQLRTKERVARAGGSTGR
ncbi:MAG: tetratricopeptide repeat protein [Phycisphaerales bacterium]|nr:tetratricopeptide repeat protein [Phycisphaerales bacterium]